MTTPKRDAIATDLRRRISDGEFQPGDMLPSIPDLQEAYGAARGTVMDALDHLQGLGVVERKIGRGGGNIVRRQIALDIYAWRDDQPMSVTSESDLFFRTVREQDRQPTQDFSVRDDVLPDRFISLLRVDDPRAVVRRCVRSVDGMPHSIQESWYPEWLCARVPILRQRDDIKTGTTRLLWSEGFHQVAARGYAFAAMPTLEEAATLRIAQTGSPVLHSVLTGYTEDGPLRISAAVFGPGTHLVSEHGDVSVIDRYRR